jgi:hypothetical protein
MNRWAVWPTRLLGLSSVVIVLVLSCTGFADLGSIPRAVAAAGADRIDGYRDVVAHPDAQCVALGGTISAADECEVSGAISASGTFNLSHTLHILSSGSITVPKASGGNTLTVNTSGGLIIESGGKIVGDAGNSPNDSAADAVDITVVTSGDVLLKGGAAITSKQTAGSCNGGTGGDITLTSSGGNVTTETGSLISSEGAHCPAGAIAITASNGKVAIGGTVEAPSGVTGGGSSTTQTPGGGPITIRAACELTVTGAVSSQDWTRVPTWSISKAATSSFVASSSRPAPATPSRPIRRIIADRRTERTSPRTPRHASRSGPVGA